jgi:poly(hydroxyalkanoate) granule-associated protein
MSRTKRTVRTSRKAATAAGRIERIKSTAIAAVNSLIEQGAALQQKGRKLAIAKVREARKAVVAGAGEARNRTAGAVSKLEHVFEQRVSRAVSRLGVPTSRDVRALSRQVAELQQSVNQLRRSRARA